MLVLLKLKRERLFRYTDNPLVNASPAEGGGWYESDGLQKNELYLDVF